MDDLIQEFLAETSESLASLDVDIVNLEQNPNDADLLSRIFRLVHTIKGTCGFLGLPRLEKVAHHSENVLGRYRDGTLQVTPDSVTLILEAFDRIKMIVQGIEETGSEPEGDDAELIARLDAVYESEDGSVPQKTEEVVADVVEEVMEAVTETMAEQPAPSQELATEPVKSDVKEPKEHKEAGATSLRVSVDVLENLMTMVSELVLTRNQLLQILRAHDDSDFAAPLQRLNHVVSDLQEGVMQTRMQPIGNAWAKLPRIIRDISVELGKKINLDMRGQETELDRQVLELIKDPLTHMVRNSGDHGIETPEERLAAGKPEEGTIRLNAYHEGGHIIIEIKDDGKGLNTDRIREKLVEKGLVTADQVRELSDMQVQQYIFAAGFSTAEKVTSVSGRGVGMDVVRSNIEKIGGTIEMKSVYGEGTTFTIKIPLTLAIVSALIVETAGERFAIPQITVQELVRVSKNGENRLEDIHGTPVLRLRDRLLPLVSLSRVLKLQDEHEGTPVIDMQSDHYIIVIQVGSQSFGIIVDRVFDTEEIVVKPVAPILRNIKMFSGNTILGDGSVIMILDPNGIASQVGDVSVHDDAQMEKREEMHDMDASMRRVSLLVFRAGDGAPRAVPLSLVSRLEEVETSRIEFSGNGQRVVQYRGKLMPMVPFSENMQIDDREKQSVLVFSDRDRSMGLIVDEIVDIVEERMDVQISGGKNGLLGSAIINGKAMDVIDVAHFLSRAFDDWFDSNTQNSFAEGEDRKKILLVDDSPFFRNMLTPLLSVAGYQVATAESADEALQICQRGEHFDLIVSDIEMPGMNGFEFAEKIRQSSGDLAEVPLLALTSHATAQDVDRGQKAGFNNYVPKFDKEMLLHSIAETIGRNKQAA